MLLKEANPTVTFLMETKLQSSRMKGVHKSLGFMFDINVPSIGSAGGLTLGWKHNCSVSL